MTRETCLLVLNIKEFLFEKLSGALLLNGAFEFLKLIVYLSKKQFTC